MMKGQYDLWIAYHSGAITRELTPEEYSEIRACEFAMHLLVPDDMILEACGGIDNLGSLYIYHNYPLIRDLAKQFKVEEEVILFKLEYLIKKYLDEKENPDNLIKELFEKKENPNKTNNLKKILSKVFGNRI